MKFSRLAVAVGLCAVALVGCDQKQSATTSTSAKLDSKAQQASYGLGLQIGSNLLATPIDGLSVEAIALGIDDALAGKESRLSQEQLDEALQFALDRAAEKQNALNDAAAKKGQEFLAENAKKDSVKTTDSGLQYEVLTAKDSGASPKATDSVTVHYTGKLLDGSVFDSSVERGTPATFFLRQVIPGWTEGLQLMKVGERYQFFIPADLAYGASSPTPAIPANSTLIFEVELLDIPSQKSAAAKEQAPAAE
ncbi:peptidylprolyl isomerase [Thiopseudomonas alkaliphila]|uniref:FKBP-type peptidyl-prolyl cis-trans isomerase n=1 Tax=Thiopseudomonas alkaliphila TaxID=1697053 RepID=UPI00069E5230|nr:FKBP-type peptidyl-prolyl cis-trans isomerase [Thiopseudomonas alkaliphila]AKX55784.1 peptidylprolyl isomerase [Thiopseudomonas alkaliphila]